MSRFGSHGAFGLLFSCIRADALSESIEEIWCIKRKHVHKTLPDTPLHLVLHTLHLLLAKIMHARICSDFTGLQLYHDFWVDELEVQWQDVLES